MSCIELLNGRDYTCLTPNRKYVQKAVLVRISHVLKYNAMISNQNYKLSFNLKNNANVVSIDYNDNANVVFGSYQKSEKNDLTQYKHKVQIATFNVSESTKTMLNSLAQAQYFACLMYQDQTIEVYGFHNGLQLADYDYNPANNNGGGILSLESVSQEYTMPYILENNPYIKSIFQPISLDDFPTPIDPAPIDGRVRFNDDFNIDFLRIEN